MHPWAPFGRVGPRVVELKRRQKVRAPGTRSGHAPRSWRPWHDLSRPTAACRRPTAMPPWPRRGLELQRATVRGAPSVRSSVHPPATLECEQRRRPVMLLWLEGFSTILAALAMLLLRPASRCQVLLPLTARPACTQPSLTAGCAPCAVGACLPLPFNHHTTRATWLGSATTCSRAGACPVHHVHRGVCGTLPRAPPMMTGGGSTSTPCCVALWLS